MSDVLELEIRRPDGEPRVFEIKPGVYSIGSDADCRIRLPHKDVATRHAILTVGDAAHWIEDLDAPTGTFVAGARVRGRAELGANQPVRIGPFSLSLCGRPFVPAEPIPLSTATPPPAVAPAPAPTVAPSPDSGTPDDNTPPATAAAHTPSSPNDTPSDAERQRSVKQQIHKELVERLDIKRLTASHVDAVELKRRALDTVQDIVRDVSDRLPPGLDPETLVTEVYDEAVGLGPLEVFLKDPAVTEIMVNGHSRIYVEKGGKVVPTNKTFMDDQSVLAVIERIVSPIGRRIDESQPYVDARLPDGSRVNAIIHPLSLVGPCLTIRKFSKDPFTDDDLIRFGTMTTAIAEFVKIAVQLRKNIIVSGGTGSGKTTLLNVFSSYLPADDRIVTIEDAAELRLWQDHVVRLESRPPNIEGKGAVPIRDLVRNTLRMRPDRIVIGECRGGEALDMLQAMNTGHDGSLTTVHANSPRDVISRLETMVLMSGMDFPLRAIREQIAAAIHLIVHEARFSDGSRKVSKVSEIVGLEGDRTTMQDIFEYVQTGIDADGRVLGQFRPTGAVPTFVEEVLSRGLTIDRTMFDPSLARDEPPSTQATQAEHTA